MKKTILFLVNVDWFFVSHRMPIAEAAIEAGYEVHLACACTDKAKHLSSLGINVHSLDIARNFSGIASEIKSFFSIYNIVSQIRPDIIHCITIKPVLYGGICARLLGIKSKVSSISGLGHVFVSSGFKSAILRFMVTRAYAWALKGKNSRVILQNCEDANVLLENKCINGDQIIMIRGSGVCLNEYFRIPESGSVPVVAMASRLLRDKGVYEFLSAAKILKKRQVKVEFWLIGAPDEENPASISREELQTWKEKGIVKIFGHRSDIPQLFAKSNIVVLPSRYGEGLPKVLIEAAACGRAVITTDHPGCRDAIEPGKTGLLVPVGDAQSLAEAIQKLVEQDDLRQQMGKTGRELAEKEFSIEKVVQAHMDVYKS